MRNKMLWLTALLASPACAQSVPVAFVHARVLAGEGRVVEDATLVLRDGLIAALAHAAAPPAGARVVDATGKTITAGLVAADTTLGLVEVSSVSGTNDAHPSSADLSVGADVQFALNPDSTVLGVARAGGVTSAITLPDGARGDGGGNHLMSGLAAAITLGDGGAILRRGRIAAVLELGEAGAKVGGGSRASDLVLLREALDDARLYARNRRAYESGNLRALSLSHADLEAIQPVLTGQVPLVVGAHSRADILQALDLAGEFKLRIIIRGGEEAWRVADRLARAHVGVILNPTDNLPKSFEVLGARADSAALLRKAGVAVAIIGNDSTHRVGEMRFNAGMAVARGLNYADALDAITLAPARLFGLDGQIGSIARGKQADIVVWDGDPFEPLTQATQIFIRGAAITAESRPEALARQYAKYHQ